MRNDLNAFVLLDWDGDLVDHIIIRYNLEDKKETSGITPTHKYWMTRLDDYRLRKKKNQGKCFKNLYLQKWKHSMVDGRYLLIC